VEAMAMVISFRGRRHVHKKILSEINKLFRIPKKRGGLYA